MRYAVVNNAFVGRNGWWEVHVCGWQKLGWGEWLRLWPEPLCPKDLFPLEGENCLRNCL